MGSEVFSLLSKPLRKEVEALDWDRATKIQDLAIPSILGEESVLLIAPTGTGKTEAAVYPIFEQLLRNRLEIPIKGVSIIYITPLRALNRDIFRRLIETGDRLGIDVQVRHGDTGQYTRRKQALRPPDMLITTPETFQAILPGKRMSRHLSSVKWVIVDEIHELADDKRGAQLSIGLERLQKLTGGDFQRVGLSATVGRPEVIASFLCGTGKRFQVLNTFESKNMEIWVESPASGEGDSKIAEEVMLSTGSVSRIQRLFELIEECRSSLVFTNTREHAEALSSRMRALRPGVRVGVHHGSLSKSARVKVEEDLKRGELKCVICTSSLELGIDVGDIDFVIQYLSPRQVIRLVQRVGRSGHLVSGIARGCVITAWPDDILEAAVISKLAVNGVLEEPKIHEKALDVLAHQVAGLALDWGGISIREVHDTVTKAWPYRELTVEELVSVAKELEERGIIRVSDWGLERSPKIFKYYYENLSMIPHVRRYSVIDFVRGRRIGSLDQEFMAKNGEIGQEFIMSGQTWRLVSLEEDDDLVKVEAVQQSFGAIPSWEGENIPVPFKIAQRVGEMRSRIASSLKKEDLGSDALKKLPMDLKTADKAIDAVERQLRKGYPVPSDKLVLIECFENYAIVHGCFGNLVNETLGRVLASLLTSRLGFNLGTQADAYRIALISPYRLDPQTIKGELTGIKPGDLKPILSGILGGTSLFTWRLWNVAKRFGIVSHEAEYSSSRGRILAATLEETPVHEEAFREIYVEKMDLDNAERVLRMIQEGRIKVDIAVKRGEYSPLSLPILDRIAPQDILRPVKPLKSIVEVVRERLESETMRLICVFKGDYNGVMSLRRIPDRVKCPNCGSTLIAATHPKDIKLHNTVKKRLRRVRLTSYEEKMWLKAWRSASLVQNYGKRALTALAARGVGATNAARLLRRYHPSEDDFFADIVRAERRYARTRMFWDE